MNKVIEEALTNMIRRIEVNEREIQELKDPDWKPKYVMKMGKTGYKPGMATEGQLKYIKILGGEIWEGITKKEAGQEIDRLVKAKPQKVTKSHSESPKDDSQLMTKQDAYERADYEWNRSKPLTKEQIEEIGKENLL